MDYNSLFFMLKWASLSAAISLVCFKCWFLVIGAKGKTTSVKSKFFGWYSHQEFNTMTSPQLWELMQTNNRITTAMWICVSISSLLFLGNL